MNTIRTIAGQFLKISLRNRILPVLYVIWLLLILYSACTGYRTYTDQNHLRQSFQWQARQSWVDNPDKHPHRMAHFGTFAFRLKHPLSMFEYGMESYTGNAVFLEAHKQNTVNFSEAGFSTGLLRFGEISLSMLVQLLLPLIVFFLGFAAVSQLKEDGTLKILVTQSGSFRYILWGTTLGLFVLSLLFLIPVLLAAGLQLRLAAHEPADSLITRMGIIVAISGAYLWIVSTVAVSTSALSDNSRASLLKLLGVWLFMAIVLPKTLQAIGSYLYPSPGKIEFETAVETDILAIGDSHNPDDPYFKSLKDSVLKAHGAETIQELPFNYSGFQMREGERMSTAVYANHLQGLFDQYERQNSISYRAVFIDPLLAVKHLNMALSGTDFKEYRHFQNKAEAYRYQLAQAMNELQIENISNISPAPGEKPHSIEKHHWEDFDDFSYTYQSLEQVMHHKIIAFAALLFWLAASVLFLAYTSRKAKAI